MIIAQIVDVIWMLKQNVCLVIVQKVNGADYIDISGMPNVEQDVISIFVREEYMNQDEEYDEEYNGDLSDDDLNQLI
jgi:hypothetical protein